MKFKIYSFLVILLAASMLIAACGSKTTDTGVKGTETTTGANQPLTPAGATSGNTVLGAPNTAAVDTLNKDLTTTSSDIDAIKVNVDASTFQ